MLYLLNTILSIIIAIVMTNIGYGVTTWQWWVVVLAANAMYILGRAIEAKERR